MKSLLTVLILITAVLSAGFAYAGTIEGRGKDIMDTKPEGYPVATFAGGCFWCTESEFRELDGVLYTRVGYTGGTLANPKYEDTHDGKSGHAEATEITFDPKKTSYRKLVEFFMTEAHDPTQVNRQGPDTGTQYRSAIFYHDDEQKKIAEDVIKELTTAHRYKDPIVTQVVPASTFWAAEDYHQQYNEKYEQKYGRPTMNEMLRKGMIGKN